MKEKYIELMGKALSAYTDEHIDRYFNEVKTVGLTEHGFPRLTVNIGILIAHGVREDLLPRFIQMMDFCCENVPRVKAANDFSVREMICCIRELEAAGILTEEVSRWRGQLATIDPTTCYTQFATAPTDKLRNWALFSAVSEYFRQKAGLCDSTEFIEMQLLQQMQWLDENGMYRDNEHCEIHNPMMYDLVPRGLYSLLLNEGYRGRSYEVIDDVLRRAALLTLKMQSPSGEIPFGGRSNQFLHNEPWLTIIYEFEAKRYAREGNRDMAVRFKTAAKRALEQTERWLSLSPIRHIKNRFPTETKYGCEKYAYFDKYMITAASFLYGAYLVCDDTIPSDGAPDEAPTVAITSEYFHKLFLKCGGYGLEFDLNADPIYDANGLGRVHRVGAPSAVCLSCPCPTRANYALDIDDPSPLSLCSAVRTEDGMLLGADESSRYELTDARELEDSAEATLLCHFSTGTVIKEHYTVNESGVSITVSGEGEIGYALPALSYDGEGYAEVACTEDTLSVTYGGWVCRYTVDGKIEELPITAANRNGHYRAFAAIGKDALNIRIEILPIG